MLISELRLLYTLNERCILEKRLVAALNINANDKLVADQH